MMIMLRLHRFLSWESRALQSASGVTGVCSLRSTHNASIGIRRETINAWERRAPLDPRHVRALVKSGITVYIQPSNRRAFPLQEYQSAGAIVQEDLSDANVIMSVKAVPIDDLMPNKTYAFFSHTIKAQKENMPLLDAILQRNIRLIDYEKMVNEKGQRLVAFGKWAGFAGMINIFHGLGLRLLALGHHTPFIHIGLAHNYRDSHMARNAIREAGYEIALGTMPRSIGPLIFVFTGTGNVSQGAQEIFQDLPYEYVNVEDLPTVSKRGNLSKVYGCVVSREDHLVRTDNGAFDPEEFDSNPELYVSTFAQKVAPYASVIVNGIFWSVKAPRLLTIPDAKLLLAPRGKTGPQVPGCPTLPNRLVALCDISADPGGSIEFMNECTTIDKPFCIYDADQNTNSDYFANPYGVLLCSIDNMPAQMPLEATSFFGQRLLPYIPDIVTSDATKPFSTFDVNPIVKNAVITSNGELTPDFSYIHDLRRQNHLPSAHKSGSSSPGSDAKVLILGAGYVSVPVVELLKRKSGTNLTVATEYRADVDKLQSNNVDCDAVLVDVQADSAEVESLIKDHDIVVSLLPFAMHPQIAKMCISHKKNMVTASYLSPEMRDLHEKAVEAGVTIVNEVGLDPGIDHLLAMECFDSIKQHGGKVLSFESFCGGLPAPECSENPLRYKFSWSPKGVLLGLLSSARYLKDGQTVDIPGGGALLDSGLSVNFLPGYSLEGYPNRDSTIYGPLYNLEGTQTILRGTLRYKGYLEAAKALVKLGLVSNVPHPALDAQFGPDHSWKEFIATLVNLKPDVFIGNVKSAVMERLENSQEQFKAVEDLGLFSEEDLVDRKTTPVDTLASYLSRRLSYEPGERDMAIMRHDVMVQWPNGEKEMHHVDFVAYGDNNGGYSAMAKTVGYTTALATEMLLTGEIQKKGMVLPMTRDIYRPLLQRLKAEGLTAKMHRSSVRSD